MSAPISKPGTSKPCAAPRTSSRLPKKNLRVARETGQRIFEQKVAAQSRIDTLPAAARDFITAVQQIWPGAELVEVRKHHKGT